MPCFSDPFPASPSGPAGSPQPLPTASKPRPPQTEAAPGPANPGPSFSALSNHSRPFNLAAVPPSSAHSVAARPLSPAPPPGVPERRSGGAVASLRRPAAGASGAREGPAGTPRSGPGREFPPGEGRDGGERARSAPGGAPAGAEPEGRAGLGEMSGAGAGGPGLAGAGLPSGCDWLGQSLCAVRRV